MDESGEIRPGATDPDVGEEQAVHMYKTMCQLQTMDTILYEAQRQGRVSFYMTCFGEEGTLIGSAAGLHKGARCHCDAAAAPLAPRSIPLAVPCRRHHLRPVPRVGRAHVSRVYAAAVC